MSENDKITEETANDTLPAEVETDLAEQETDVMPAEPEEEEIAPEDVKIFGMPRHVFHLGQNKCDRLGGRCRRDRLLFQLPCVQKAQGR